MWCQQSTALMRPLQSCYFEISNLSSLYLFLLVCSKQNPALVDAPISLQITVKSPPKCSIKTSGATVVMTAVVKVTVLPEGHSPVQLSSMTMVHGHSQQLPSFSLFGYWLSKFYANLNCLVF